MVCYLPIFSQVQSEGIPLVEVLDQLEKQFLCKFTYADDTINDVFLHKNKEIISLKEALLFLTNETGLIFSVIDAHFISINKKGYQKIICGIFRDRETGDFIENVSIRGKNASTLSNEQGHFRLEIHKEKETIIIGHLGYATIYRLSDSFVEEDCQNIYMDAKVEMLSEVTLKDYLTKGIDKINDGSFQIDYNDFGILPGLIETDVLQTVQALPGIQSTDETVSNINIRGGSHDQNLLLWDGIKMYQTSHFFGLISAFNSYITNTASLIKDGTSPEYTDGVSGTILMNSDTRVNDKFKSSLGINMIDVDVFTDIPVGKKSSLELAGRKSISNFLETPTYTQFFNRIFQDSEVENNQGEAFNSDMKFGFFDANLRWNFFLTDIDKLRVNFLTINNQLDFVESALINTFGVSRRSKLEQNSIAGGIWYERIWNTRFKTILQLYETDYQLKSINANIKEEQRFLQENRVSETSFKLKTFYKPKKRVTWLNGYQFIETGVSNLNDIDNPILRDKIIEVIRTHSLFSQIAYQEKNNKTSLNFGVRYNYNEKFKSHIIEPRLSYNQSFFKYFNLELLGEFKHQNTSQIINFQTDFLGVEKRRWVLANNKDIPVVKSKQASLGLQYDRKGLLISIEGYYKFVEGITARSQGFRNQYEFEKGIGDYTIKGCELLINKRFKDLSAWISYSYAKNEYFFNTFREKKFLNNKDLKHSLTIGGLYTVKNLKLSAGLNWNSGLPTTKPVSGVQVIENQINYNSPNSSRLKEYIRVDISAIYDYKLTENIDIQAGISVWNLTNHDNVISNYYQLDQDNSPLEIMNTALGTTPNASLRIIFK